VPDVELPQTEKLGFIVMGDGGTGSATQKNVADAVANVCNLPDIRCDFALLLGDNIYPGGAYNVNAPEFIDMFEEPYAELDFPFFLVLGNHDYGGSGAGFEFWKGQVQVDYTKHSSPQHSGKWRMPAHHYSFRVKGGTANVDFFAIDTNSIFYRSVILQRWWLNRTLDQSCADWKIVYGHHTYISNGSHGNAGNYEGVANIPLIDGRSIKDFFDEVIIGKADLYLAGHDHNRQLLGPVNGTRFIVSGTGAKAKGLEHRDPNTTIYESDQKAGFVLIEITDESSLRVRFYDENPGDPPVPNFDGSLSSTLSPAGCAS
jgi:tartrate-resistant acid phosphatase type 5